MAIWTILQCFIADEEMYPEVVRDDVSYKDWLP